MTPHTLDLRFQEPEVRETLIDELARLEWSEPGSLARIEQALTAGLIVGNVTVSGSFGDPYGHAAYLNQGRARTLQAHARMYQREHRDDYSILEELVLPVQRGDTTSTSPILHYLKYDILPLASLRASTSSQIWAKQLAAHLLPERPFHLVSSELERLRVVKDRADDPRREERSADHLVMAALRMNGMLTENTMSGEQLLRLHLNILEWLRHHPQPEQIRDEDVWRLLAMMFGAAISPYGDIICAIEEALRTR